jgi:hypothetical protein
MSTMQIMLKSILLKNPRVTNKKSGLRRNSHFIKLIYENMVVIGSAEFLRGQGT